MLEIGKEYYTWGGEELRRIFERILSGDVVTINYKKEEAHLNYYVGKETLKVPFDYANLLSKLQVIVEESGNWETGERHYQISTEVFLQNMPVKEAVLQIYVEEPEDIKSGIPRCADCINRSTTGIHGTDSFQAYCEIEEGKHMTVAPIKIDLLKGRCNKFSRQTICHG